MPLPETLTELREMREVKAKELKDIFDEAGDTFDFTKVEAHDLKGKTTAEKTAAVRARNDELKQIGEKLDPLIEIEAIRIANDRALKDAKTPRDPFTPPDQGDGKGGGGNRIKTLREIFAEDAAYTAFKKGEAKSATIELSPEESKTLITVATLQPPNVRRPGIVEMALEQRTLADLMLQGEVGGPLVEYYEETTLTNNAAAVAEGAVKPESELGYTLRSDRVEKYATWVPMTDESLKDIPRLQSTVEGRLMFMLARKREDAILNGTGTTPEIRGILNRTGIQTQAMGGDTAEDAVYKAITKIEVNAFADPDVIVMHPNDWQTIRLRKTTDGIYIWGSPIEAGPERMWGRQLRKTTAITEGTGLVGAFRPYAEYLRYGGVQVIVSTEHSDFVIRNKVLVLVEERFGLAVYRPAAFCTVTGI